MLRQYQSLQPVDSLTMQLNLDLSRARGHRLWHSSACRLCDGSSRAGSDRLESSQGDRAWRAKHESGNSIGEIRFLARVISRRLAPADSLAQRFVSGKRV